MLSVKNIVKTYEDKALLDGISFEVRAGEILCLLGTSGSGKTTLLRIIAGIETAESGKILWNEEELSLVPTHLRQFGLMFQDYALFPHRNVFQNAAFGLRMQKKGAEEIKKRTNEVLELVDMVAFAERDVFDLSGGEQQRVALARALAPKPRLLMLDEPLGALDRSLKEDLIKDLRHILHKAGVPSIYVTHDQEEAFAIADRMMLLHNGRIAQEGTAEEIYAHPANAWTAEFFGLGNLLAVRQIDRQKGMVETGLGWFRPRELPQAEDGDGGWKVLLRAREAVVVSEGQRSENAIEGEVIECRFQGSNWRVVLRCGEQEEIYFFSNEALKVGSRTRVWFAPETVSCLREMAEG